MGVVIQVSYLHEVQIQHVSDTRAHCGLLRVLKCRLIACDLLPMFQVSDRRIRIAVGRDAEKRPQASTCIGVRGILLLDFVTVHTSILTLDCSKERSKKWIIQRHYI